jgi:hypothetical protein
MPIAPSDNSLDVQEPSTDLEFTAAEALQTVKLLDQLLGVASSNSADVGRDGLGVLDPEIFDRVTNDLSAPRYEDT